MNKAALYKKLMAVSASALLFILPVFGQYNSFGVPDSANIRRELKGSWLDASIHELREKQPEVIMNAYGENFRVSFSEEAYETYSIIVAPESSIVMNYVSDSATRTVHEKTYKESACGSWIMARNKSDGSYAYIRMYFTNNPEVYIQLRPFGTKTYADVVVFGNYVVRSIPLSTPFTNLYSMSFQDFYRATKKTIDWTAVMPVAGQYDDVLIMTDEIRKKLPDIIGTDYAAYNENGELCSILTGKPMELSNDDTSLNAFVVDPSQTVSKSSAAEGKLYLGSAGFVKWIVDGIVVSIKGSGTKISELLVPTVDYEPTGKKGILMKKRSLTLNLDWNRHLAEQVLSLRSTKQNFTYETGGLDVDEAFFVAKLAPNGDYSKGLAVENFINNTGYRAENITGLMYMLAIKDPSWFYLGAVRESDSVKADESVFNNSAAFFPYFDGDGKFNCIIFANGREYTLRQFIENNKDNCIYFERIRATDCFELR